MARLPHAQKLAYEEMFFRSHGHIPGLGPPLAEWRAEALGGR